MSGIEPGPLALVGGDELKPGNEEQDRRLAAVATQGGGRAFVLATAAAGGGPDLAVANARRWFASLDLEVEELPATTRSQLSDGRVARLATEGRFFYLVGGNPRQVVEMLAGTPVWAAVLGAWRDGAALAGSSAGAMGMAGTTLVPGSGRAIPGLGVVPGAAVIPHFESFRRDRIAEALRLSADAVLVGIDERTAAFWTASGWRVCGPGRVTVLRGGDDRRFGPGEEIEGIPAPDGC